MALQGQSHIKITADVNDAKAKLQQMQAQLRNTGKTADDVSSSIQGAFQKIGSAMAVGLSVAGLQQFTNQLIQTRGQFQQLEIAFGTMLGSTEKADALMKQLTQTAAKTPFDMQGIANGAKQLLAYGTAAEDVNDTIVKLGDIAAGLSLPLGDLVYLYGTTMTQGRMFTMDLRQMQGRGIPIADEIAKIMNVSKDAVPEMVTAGKVTSEIFSQAIKNMSSEGGKFYNLMEKQSSSLTGQISNLEDAIDQMFNEIGKSSEDFLSSGISAVSFLVENYKYLGAAIASVVSAVGIHKAAQMTIAAGYNAEAKILKELTQAKEDDLATDLKKAVQWGVMTQEQAEEINLLRQKLQTELEVAQEEDRIAGERLANAQREHQIANENLILAQDEVDSLNEKIMVAQQARDMEELSNLQSEKATALEALNTAQTELNTSAENLNTASKAKNTTAQQVNTAQTAVDTATTKANTTAKRVLTNVVGGLRKQIIAMGKALMANPLFILASIVLGAVSAISTFIASIEDEEEQQAKVNEEHQKFIDQIEKEKNTINQSMSILDDKTASLEKQAIAYHQLQGVIAELQGMSFSEFMALSPQEKQAIKERAEALQEQQIRENEIAEARKNLEDKKNSFWSTPKEVKDAQNIYDNIIKKYEEQDEAVRVAKMNPEEQIKYYEEQYRALEKQQGQLEWMNKEWKEIQGKLHNISDIINGLKNPKIEIDTKSTFDQMSKDAQSSIEGFDQRIVDIYNTLYQGGGIYRNSNGKANGGFKMMLLDDVEDRRYANANRDKLLELDELIKKYSTGKKGSKAYSDLLSSVDNLAKREDEITKLQKKAEDERVAYMRKKQEDKRKLIIDNKNAQIKAINEEEKEFNKTYGKTKESQAAFNKRRNTVRLNAELDLAQLDKEFKQWKDDFEKGNNKIKFDIEMASLNHQLEITDDVNKKLEIQKTIRQKLIDQQKEELELEKQQAIKEKFGEQALKDYLAGTSTNAQVKEVAQGYDEKINLSTQQMEQENEITDYAERLQRYEEYANGVIEIEKRKAENLRALASGDSVATKEEIEIASNLEKEQLAKDLGITDIPTDIMNLVNEITTSSIKNIKQNLDKVLEELEESKKEAEAEIAKANEKELTFKEEEAKLQEEQEAINQIEDPIAQKEAQIALDEKIAELEQKRSANNQVLIANQNKLSAVTATAKKVNEQYKDSLENLTPAQKHWEQTMEKVGKSSAALRMVSDSIKLVQQEFGDLLSEGANDALSTITLITDVTTGMLDGVKFSALASKEGIKSIEGASAILAIISAAIQVVMAIVNVLMKYFSAEAKQKAQMEEYNMTIDEMAESRERFERSFKDKTGIDYWQNMAKSAEMYNQEIREAQEAQEKAQEFYDRQKDRYGEDSKKAQEAKESLDEQTDITNEKVDAQAEKIKEVFEQMATTSVTSFGETMADALVSAFSEGLDGMNKAWEDTINDMIKSMLTQRMALQLTDQFEEAFDRLEQATSEDSVGGATITDGEMSTFLMNMDKAKSGAMAIGEEYQKLFAELGLLDDADIEAESKGFQAMSQDTADELNGRFTALQITGAGIQMSAQGIATSVEDIARINMGIQGGVTELANNSSVALQIAQNQLNELRIISENTSMLTETNSRLKQIQDNTARL